MAAGQTMWKEGTRIEKEGLLLLEPPNKKRPPEDKMDDAAGLRWVEYIKSSLGRVGMLLCSA